MTLDEIRSADVEGLTARAAEIDSMELEGRDADTLTQLADERDQIAQAIAEKRLAAKREQEKREQALEETRTIATPPEKEERQTMYTYESPEYRSAFLKTMLGQELNAEERDAISYVATTGDSTYNAKYAVPKTMVNEIWDRVAEEHAILNDITMYHTNTVLEVAVRASITQGDAASVNENAANDDEVNTWAQVSISGQDFSKHVNISYAMAKMSAEAFEAYLVNEISQRLGAAMASYVITTINSGYDSSNNNLSTASASKVAFTDVAAAMSVLKNAKGQCVVYASRTTIYKYLVGMVDTTGRPIFQVNAQDGKEGDLIGCPVKTEDAISGDVMWIGFPRNVIGNTVQDIMIENDRDIKKHMITYSGYCRFGAALAAPASFAKLTVTAPQSGEA